MKNSKKRYKSLDEIEANLKYMERVVIIIAVSSFLIGLAVGFFLF